MSKTNRTKPVEVWRAVVGYEGLYEVSSLGRVRSVDRYVRATFGSKQFRPGCVLNPNRSGPYPTHKLSRRGIQKTHRVHTLVLEAFVGPRPNGMECRHFPDGSHENNRLDNLSWGTPKQNTADKESHGQILRGERISNSKLRKTDVLRIRRLYDYGEHSQEELARMFGICQAQIWRIVRRLEWTHV